MAFNIYPDGNLHGKKVNEQAKRIKVAFDVLDDYNFNIDVAKKTVLD